MPRDRPVEVRIGPQGRLVIPAPLRKRLGLQEGDRLIAHLEDGRLVLETRANILDRLQRRFEGIPPGVSLADELILERHAAGRTQSEQCELPY